MTAYDGPRIVASVHFGSSEPTAKHYKENKLMQEPVTCPCCDQVNELERMVVCSDCGDLVCRTCFLEKTEECIRCARVGIFDGFAR